MKPPSPRTIWNLAIVGILAGLVLGSCAPVAPPPPQRERPSGEKALRPPLAPRFAELAARLRPSVVHVRARRPGAPRRRGLETGGLSTDLREFFKRLFGNRRESAPQEPGEAGDDSLGGTGTGFLIGSEGEILTNHHVVEGADQIRVRLYEGEWLEARVVGADPRTDLALLRVKTQRPLRGASLGDSGRVRVGEWVLAIGNPFGLEETVTAGILSAKGRALGSAVFTGYLQTDAPIHAGNSGGPLLNLKGEVIGVNTAVAREATGIGFAIPINLVRRLLPDLRKHGRVRRGWIGVSVQDVDPGLRRHFKLPGAAGVLITHLQAKGPATKGGLRPGDVILSLGGFPLRGSEDFGRALERAPIGVPAKLEVIRGGKKLNVSVTVRELKVSRPASIRPAKPVSLRHPPLGLELRPLSPQMADRMGLEDPAGLIAATVDPGGPADRAGVRRGDVIRSIGLRAVRTLKGFREILKGLKGPKILVLIQRSDQHFFTLLDVFPGEVKALKPAL